MSSCIGRRFIGGDTFKVPSNAIVPPKQSIHCHSRQLPTNMSVRFCYSTPNSSQKAFTGMSRCETRSYLPWCKYIGQSGGYCLPISAWDVIVFSRDMAKLLNLDEFEDCLSVLCSSISRAPMEQWKQKICDSLQPIRLYPCRGSLTWFTMPTQSQSAGSIPLDVLS